ncbi:MAG: hypothetical protein WC229_01890 [Candidatus Paceibacterota bacterium]|jgi:hypothetical protein
MVKISSIFVLGILVMLMPFSGFPFGWKDAIYKICGLAIIVLSLLIRKELHEVLRSLHNNEVIKADTFTESIPQEKSGDEK